jgi:aminopeptidase N
MFTLLVLLQATFVVVVEAPAALAVLSNAAAASTRWVLSIASSSVSRVTFQPTPPMSTYLLSVAVGELKAVSGKTSR